MTTPQLPMKFEAFLKKKIFLEIGKEAFFMYLEAEAEMFFDLFPWGVFPSSGHSWQASWPPE